MRSGTVFLVITAVMLMVFAAGAVAQPLLLPRAADRTKGEALFASAYRDVLQGRIPDAMETLDEALRWDPYLVEYYLLKGYCRYLLGDYDKAVELLRLYLEVRPGDAFAVGFLKQIESRMSLLESVLQDGVGLSLSVGSPGFFPDRTGISAFSIDRFRIPGRPAGFGNLLALCDRSEEKAWLFEYNEAEGEWKRFYAGDAGGAVVRILPVEKDRTFFVYDDGSILKAHVSKEGIHERQKGQTKAADPSDAVYTGSGILVVADRIGRQILYVDAESLDVTGRWRSGEDSFEPVALAALGRFLAVADRSGGIFVLDLETRELLRDVSIPGPVRAVEWLNSSNLLALVEGGDLYHLKPASGEPAKQVATIFPEAWFLFSIDRDVMIADTRLYRCSTVTGHASRGTLVLREPKPVDSGNGSLFEVTARVLRPLGAGKQGDFLFQGVLGGYRIDIDGTLLDENDEGDLPLVPKLPVKAPLWELEDLSDLPEACVIDASQAPRGESWLSRLGGFALSQGLTIHVLAERALPTSQLLRLAELTGGEIVLSDENPGTLERPEKWVLSLRVSDQLLIPGGGAWGGGLFLIGRSGSLSMEDRFPLWSVFARPVQLPEGEDVKVEPEEPEKP
jgi:tetratricopeptide (TPR) repeat protein